MSDRAFYTHEEEEHFIDSVGLALLLHADVLFANTRPYVCPFAGVRPETIVLFMNCNDVFAWGCADAESIKLDEVPALYRLWRANKIWGPIKWVCMRRKQKPQGPVERDMKDAGQWDDEMEALPRNRMDEAVHKQIGAPFNA